MMKRTLVGFAGILTMVTLLLGMTPNAQAARCESGDGKTCSGPCCWADSNDCHAGPCAEYY